MHSFGAALESQGRSWLAERGFRVVFVWELGIFANSINLTPFSADVIRADRCLFFVFTCKVRQALLLRTVAGSEQGPAGGGFGGFRRPPNGWCAVWGGEAVLTVRSDL